MKHRQRWDSKTDIGVGEPPVKLGSAIGLALAVVLCSNSVVEDIEVGSTCLEDGLHVVGLVPEHLESVHHAHGAVAVDSRGQPARVCCVSRDDLPAKAEHNDSFVSRRRRLGQVVDMARHGGKDEWGFVLRLAQEERMLLFWVDC